MKTVIFFLMVVCSGSFSFAQYAYVGSATTGKLYVVDLENENVADSIDVGGHATTGVFTHDFSRFYVPIFESASVLEIDPTTHFVVDTIPVGLAPTFITMNISETRAYVCNQASNSVSVIDLTTNTVIQTLPVGSYPTQIVLSPNEDFLYVTNSFDNEVGVYYLSPFTELSANLFSGPTIGLASADGIQFFCSIQDAESGKLALFQPMVSAYDTIEVDSHPHDVMVRGNKVYVSSLDSNTVTVLDINTMQTTIVEVGDYPTCLAFDLTGQYYYSTNGHSGTISKIDASTNLVTSHIPVAEQPYGISVFPKNVGLDEFGNSDVVVYPNPSKGHFTIELPESNGSKQLIRLHTLDGKEIASYSTTLDVFELNADLATGVYLLSVENTKGSSCVKVEVR